MYEIKIIILENILQCSKLSKIVIFIFFDWLIWPKLNGQNCSIKVVNGLSYQMIGGFSNYLKYKVKK